MWYSRNGQFPSDLPAYAVANGIIYEDLANNAAGLVTCGFVAVSDPPSFDANSAALAWDTANAVWIVEPLPQPSLDDLRAENLQALQIAKANALASMQYTVNSVAYNVTLSTQDQLDVMMQLQILQSQPAGATCPWEIVNGQFLQFEVSDLAALQNAGIAHVNGVYANTEQLTAQINAANASSLPIDVTQGWPA